MVRLTLAASQSLDKLGLVDDAHKLLGRHLDHLLAQQRAAAALDHIQLRVDLVGAVDRHVQRRLRVQRRQGDAQACEGWRGAAAGSWMIAGAASAEACQSRRPPRRVRPATPPPAGRALLACS
jgi:hypothetical protein